MEEPEVSEVSSAVESDNVPEQPSEEEKEPTVVVQPQEKTTAESLTKVSEDIMALSSSLSRSMVTVIGVTEDKDWFNETYENQGQLSGLIVAKEDKAYYILTEYRVVKDVNRIMVTFAGGQTADARFVKCDVFGNHPSEYGRCSREDTGRDRTGGAETIYICTAG